MDDIMEKESREDQSWYSWLRTLVCVVLATVLVFTLVVRIVRVEKQSMRETLQNGDILLTVNRHLAGELKAGDIVVIKKEYFEDGKPIVKRIIATEGQTVDIDFDAGVVYVDGQALEEDYIREPTYLDEGLEFPITVPEGCLFLLGDNRSRRNQTWRRRIFCSRRQQEQQHGQPLSRPGAGGCPLCDRQGGGAGVPGQDRGDRQT